jgi:hypothetical protein
MPRKVEGKLLAKGLTKLANCMHNLAPLVNDATDQIFEDSPHGALDLVDFDRALAKAAKNALKEAARAYRKA